jgi:S-adenosylmethionine:tRNA ribosyltransferase-isomerase
MNLEEIKKIKLSDYQYFLPEEKIAKYPVSPRDASKLLVYQNGYIEESHFYELAKFIPSNSLIVFNNTRVIPARIHFKKETGSIIEILLLEPFNNSYEKIFQEKYKVQWKCMVGNAKKWKINEKLTLKFNNDAFLEAQWLKKTQSELIVEFTWNTKQTFEEILSLIGKIPLPPYLNRPSENRDFLDYQTIYAKNLGAVAAPTAGLHFTENVFNQLKIKNIDTTEVTLHVSAGTFKSISAQHILEHTMHEEICYISQQTIKKLYEHSDCIISVGTTSLRVLESLYWFTVNKFQTFEQWFPYQNQTQSHYNFNEILLKCLDFMEKNNLNIITFPTRLFIVPGYQFHSANGLITNFHQPESTLILLVAAWLGEDWKNVYKYALENNFRFLSYGDSSLLFRKKIKNL